MRSKGWECLSRCIEPLPRWVWGHQDQVFNAKRRFFHCVLHQHPSCIFGDFFHMETLGNFEMQRNLLFSWDYICTPKIISWRPVTRWQASHPFGNVSPGAQQMTKTSQAPTLSAAHPFVCLTKKTFCYFYCVSLEWFYQTLANTMMGFASHSSSCLVRCLDTKYRMEEIRRDKKIRKMRNAISPTGWPALSK